MTKRARARKAGDWQPLAGWRQRDLYSEIPQVPCQDAEVVPGCRGPVRMPEALSGCLRPARGIEEVHWK